MRSPKNSDKPLEIKFDKLLDKKDNSIDTILDPTETNPVYSISEHVKDVLTAWDEFYHGVDVDIIGFPVWSSYFKTERIDPSYPEWKKDFVRKNQELYLRNKDFIDGWLKK